MSRFLLPAMIIAMALHNEQAASADAASPPLKTIESCRTIPNDAARLRCFEEATSNFSQPPVSPKIADDWRLVRTPGPKPGADVISMMRTADLVHSDPQFAGISIHCGDAGPEILLITVAPFPPRSKPRVTLGGPLNEAHFEASVLPSGAALLLPREAMDLKGPWLSQVELPIKIEDGDNIVRGVVSINGMTAALNTLTASCTPRK